MKEATTRADVIFETDEREEMVVELRSRHVRVEEVHRFVWRLNAEPRHLVAEHRAYVSALAHGGE